MIAGEIRGWRIWKEAGKPLFRRS